MCSFYLINFRALCQYVDGKNKQVIYSSNYPDGIAFFFFFAEFRALKFARSVMPMVKPLQFYNVIRSLIYKCLELNRQFRNFNSVLT